MLSRCVRVCFLQKSFPVTKSDSLAACTGLHTLTLTNKHKEKTKTTWKSQSEFSSISQRHQSGQAEIYLQETPGFQLHDAKALLNILSIEKGSKVLDLGCGTGNVTTLLAERVGSKGHVIGIDPDGERIKTAKETHSKENITYLVADGETFPEDQYDLVFSNHVIHWIEDKGAVFKRVNKSLRPNGQFAFAIGTSIPPLYDEILDTLEYTHGDSARKKLVYVPLDIIDNLVITHNFITTYKNVVANCQPFPSIEAVIHFLFGATSGGFDMSLANEEALERLKEKYREHNPVEFCGDMAHYVLTKRS